MPNNGDVSDSKSEEGKDKSENVNIPNLRRNIPRGPRRSDRIAGHAPQYEGLYCTVDGKDDLLDTTSVSSLIQRDECFLSSVDLNSKRCGSSSATKYLDQRMFLSSDETIESTHPYAFSAKVQTRYSDNLTTKILHGF